MPEIFFDPLLSDANLEAYYRMEAGALITDSSGNGKTLTNTNSVAENTNGIFTGCADFGSANSNKKLGIADELSYNGGAYGISFWIKLNSEIASGTWHILDLEENTHKTSLNVRYAYNGGTRQLQFYRTRGGVTDVGFTYNITLGTSNWYHVVMTYNGTTLRAYINGVDIGNVAASGDGSAVLAGLALASYTNGGNYASILLDDVAFFSRDLVSGDVAILYNELSATTNYLTNYRGRKRTPGAVSV